MLAEISSRSGYAWEFGHASPIHYRIADRARREKRRLTYLKRRFRRERGGLPIVDRPHGYSWYLRDGVGSYRKCFSGCHNVLLVEKRKTWAMNR